ncbi:4Fe-4S binding protein [Aminithiophilus ramosus]|uniref:4Fe-4S binding protein n=1 Tax=Aminithiophilus ramosus TaxID=3029084 RepID=A0A9Q7AK83_9BACT|nr:thiamine pyrophosphate-dependent enzyme [Aminithiophilus ramosus]QTX33080.1 4Fe-4S binding protein [Aminithiophilus ramosus]
MVQFSGSTIQISPEDCTGCSLCVQNCPARSKKEEGKKAINMVPQPPLRESEKANWTYFLSLPDMDRGQLNLGTVKDIQLLRPLFEFSGACAGCGETPYVKLLSQLFGDRALIANATGCSSIYGGNLPTTPWTSDGEGRGPSWSNSLFEDNAEFGMGMRLALDKQLQYALELLEGQKEIVGQSLVADLVGADQSDEKGIAAQRERVARLKANLAGREEAKAKDLLSLADVLVRKNVWILGGDGWAYDIGYGGLDHVLASGRNVNVLVLDTEVYSNTGGQMSKSTPMGAVAKFAAGGKPAMKKDLALMAMAYGNVYVARVALGASDAQVVKAFREAESYDGPSIIIAYAHCIAHGIELKNGLEQQKKAVASGHWITMRYDPRRREEGKNPLTLDNKEPSLPLEDYIYGENRYRILQRAHPEEAARLLERARAENAYRWKLYQHMAAMAD